MSKNKSKYTAVFFGYFFSIVLFLLIISSSLFFSACESKEKYIRIGNQAVFSGDDKFFGEDQLISLSIAASELSPVRVSGFDYKINIITKDDEGNAERAFLIAQEFADEGVSAVIGSTFNGTTKASLPVYSEFNIPLITPSSQGEEISRGFSNFFRMIINNSQKVENIANFISEVIKPEKLIIIDNGSDYSIKLLDFLIEIFESRNITFQKRYSVNFNSDDYNILAENLLIDEPDIIFFCAKYNELADLITRVRKLNLNSQFIAEEIGMDEGITAITDSQYLEGIIAIVPEPPSLAKYSEDKKAIEFWRKYNDYVLKMKDDDISREGPGVFAPYCYDAFYILINAMKKANSISPEDFMGELKSTSYDGVVGHIEFNSNGERVDPPSTVFIIKNGVWIRYLQ